MFDPTCTGTTLLPDWRRWLRLIAHGGLALALAVFAGCAADGVSPQRYTVRQMSLEKANAMRAAEIALVDLGYQIAIRDARAGKIETLALPRAIGTTDEGFAQRRLVPRRGREAVEVVVATVPPGVSVYCQVAIQELATETYRLQQQDARSSDLPASRTAIDEDAATTQAQNTVWRTVRRDRAREQAILAAIEDRAKSGSEDNQSPD